MRSTPSSLLEKGRVLTGPYGSNATFRMAGVFIFRLFGKGPQLLCMSSPDGYGWEHVSVSILREERTPTWDEMAFVKDLFWDEEETVVQFHPPASHYVNNHPFVLHLWKPVKGEIELPPDILVGIKAAGVLSPGRPRHKKKGAPDA